MIICNKKLANKYWVLILVEVVTLVLFAVFVRYPDPGLGKDIGGDGSSSANAQNQTDAASKISAKSSQEEAVVEMNVYTKMMHVHGMLFVGFGFLMVFLRRYGYSSLGFNWLLAVLGTQMAIIWSGLIRMDVETYSIHLTVQELCRLTIELGTHLDLTSFVAGVNNQDAEIVAATVLISFGAILGRATGPQLIVMSVIEVIAACGNILLVTQLIQTKDAGGSIVIHAFGAYFGLAVSAVLGGNRAPGSGAESADAAPKEPSYTSDILAMIGSIFLWMYWPSFNAAEVETPEEEYLAVINTILSLLGATIAAFVTSSFTMKDSKFEMMHIQNATLAGGVMVGTVANMHLSPFGAMLLGCIAGTISVLFYHCVTPKLDRWAEDTCGVHNLHGTPGVLSALVSILVCGLTLPANEGWSQGLRQLEGLACTLGVALLSGLFTGLLLKQPVFAKLETDEAYEDERHWVVAKQV